VSNGGVRTFYTQGVTDANGTVTVNLTEDNAAGGVALFTEIWSTSGESSANVTTMAANDVIIGARKSVGTALKTLTYVFVRGGASTLGSNLLAIVGTLIPGLRAVPAGTPVLLRIDGI
jgi:hypothetical protein